MKIFFATDIHGSTLVWKKLTHIPSIHKVDLLLLAGDLTGKALVPIVKQRNGSYVCSFLGDRWGLPNERRVKEMEEKIASTGLYSLKCDHETVRELKEDPEKLRELMRRLIEDRIKDWMDLLVKRTKDVIRVVMPGNDDDFCIDSIIRAYKDDGVVFPLDDVVNVFGIEILSLDYVNPTPWRTPRELSEEKLEEKINKIICSLSDPGKGIFNFHSPPFNTQLDLAPELDRKLRPVYRFGRIKMVHVGSRAVRKAIVENQPLLGLHGHIHESAGFGKIGKTLVVNPGSEYSEGILRGIIFELSGGGVEKYWRIEG